MSPLDPAFVTLTGSVLGAITFFAAGYIWKSRPRLAEADTSSPSAPVQGHTFKVPPSPLPARRFEDAQSSPRPSSPVRPGLPIAETLKQVARAIGGKSSMVFDREGLPLSRGPESTLVGARLASLLAADLAQTEGKNTTESLKVVQSGPIRIQKLELHGLPDAWLVSLSARRFAVQKELDLVAKALSKVLGKSLAEDPFA